LAPRELKRGKAGSSTLQDSRKAIVGHADAARQAQLLQVAEAAQMANVDETAARQVEVLQLIEVLSYQLHLLRPHVGHTCACLPELTSPVWPLS
jgi:hypothetical protein